MSDLERGKKAWEPFAAIIASQANLVAQLSDETLLELYETRGVFTRTNCWWASWAAANGNLGDEVANQVYLRAQRAVACFIWFAGRSDLIGPERSEGPCLAPRAHPSIPRGDGSK